MRRLPADLECWEIEGGDYRVFVFTLPEESAIDLLSELTDAEREVVDLALSGLSDREIARQRDTAVRTAINQLRSACRKLGVSGRLELAQRLSAWRSAPSAPPKK